MNHQQLSNRHQNFAFIDSNNLHLGIRNQGWKLDYRRFRIYLRDKYRVLRAYLFMGYVPEQVELYASLELSGYVLVFKPIVRNTGGAVKGNCDAELVLQAMIDFSHYDRAVIVSGDGDFHCLVKYLQEQQKLESLLIPDRRRFSWLLREFVSNTAFMNELRYRLKK